MSGQGLYFALTEEDAMGLNVLFTDEDRRKFLKERLEPAYASGNRAYVADVDKAWDAIHRALTDGELTWQGGEYPFDHAVLGGDRIHAGETYIMVLKTPDQVSDVAAALTEILETAFRTRYELINPNDYADTLSDEDFEYTWHWFQAMRKFYTQAAKDRRYVLFAAEQETAAEEEPETEAG